MVSASYKSSTASSGVLTVTSGGSANVVAAIDLMGHYVTLNFHVIAAPGGTVEIFDPPLAKQLFIAQEILTDGSSIKSSSVVVSRLVTTRLQQTISPSFSIHQAMVAR